jgi:hypothetical protein
MTPSFSRIGASTEPGAVHCRIWLLGVKGAGFAGAPRFRPQTGTNAGARGH